VTNQTKAFKIGRQEFSLLEPGVVDNKWYANKVGEVREATVQGGNDFLELVSVS
jgi:hypothetical protein